MCTTFSLTLPSHFLLPFPTPRLVQPLSLSHFHHDLPLQPYLHLPHPSKCLLGTTSLYLSSHPHGCCLGQALTARCTATLSPMRLHYICPCRAQSPIHLTPVMSKGNLIQLFDWEHFGREWCVRMNGVSGCTLRVCHFTMHVTGVVNLRRMFGMPLRTVQSTPVPHKKCYGRLASHQTWC